MQILDVAKLAKHFLEVLLTRLLMDVGDEDDPAFDGAHGHGSSEGVLVRCGGGFGAVVVVVVVVAGRRGGVDVHFVGCHG